MQKLGIIIIVFKKVVSLHLLTFQDGRRRTQHFHLRSPECCSVSVYRYFDDCMYENHVYFILREIEEKCSVKNLV